jgi:hypothetical protein
MCSDKTENGGNKYALVRLTACSRIRYLIVNISKWGGHVDKSANTMRRYIYWWFLVTVHCEILWCVEDVREIYLELSERLGRRRWCCDTFSVTRSYAKSCVTPFFSTSDWGAADKDYLQMWPCGGFCSVWFYFASLCVQQSFSVLGSLLLAC